MNNFQFYNISVCDTIHKRTEYKNFHEISNFRFDFVDNSNNEIILIIALKTEKYIDKKFPFLEVLQRYYGLCCELIDEKQYIDGCYLIRIGAVLIKPEQNQELLQILHEKSFWSFCIVANKSVTEVLAKQLIEYLNYNNFIKSINYCISLVLEFGASLIHILNGCDGYSINQFYR